MPLTFDPGDQVYITGGAADHGVLAWAKALWGSFGHDPNEIVTACYYLGVRTRDSGLDSIPPGEFAQTTRLKDGVRFSGGGFGIPQGPNADWSGACINGFSGGYLCHVTFALGTGSIGSNAHWPDGTLVSLGAPTDYFGALIVVSDCGASAGVGAGWQSIVPDKSPILGGAGGLAGMQWKLDFGAIGAPSDCGGGGGGGGGGGTPDAPSGIDVLYWKEGYHIAIAGNNAIQVTGKWHSDQGPNAGLIPTSTIDTGAEFWEPKLAHPLWTPPLSVTYRKKASTGSAALFRKESYDYGRTWIPDPANGGAYMPVKHGVEVWNGRTGERVTLYNDGSGRDSSNNANGTGAIKADVYGPHLDESSGKLKFIATYPVTEAGALADDSSFGAIWVQDLGAIDCVVMIAQSAKTYRSLDDGRTWLAS